MPLSSPTCKLILSSFSTTSSTPLRDGLQPELVTFVTFLPIFCKTSPSLPQLLPPTIRYSYSVIEFSDGKQKQKGFFHSVEKIRLIETNAKCCYLKKILGILRQVFICLRPPTPLSFCFRGWSNLVVLNSGRKQSAYSCILSIIIRPLLKAIKTLVQSRSEIYKMSVTAIIVYVIISYKKWLL